MPARHHSATPSAARLTGSLRDIGYDFPAAVADLVDNSLSAGALHIDLRMDFDGADSRVSLADDGHGMTANGVLEALRFGSRRDYGRDDLGRFGLGLKTASLSQCRSVTVLSRREGSARVSVRQLDLDLIAEWDDWLIVDPGRTALVRAARQTIDLGFNTVVVWDKLDRLFPTERSADGGWARRRFEALVEKTMTHLSMVFHRFLEADRQSAVTLTVNGQKLEPWNPFAPDEPSTQALPELKFELPARVDATGCVSVLRHILPPRSSFSSPEQFESLSGPKKWNRQQGLYVFRANRLIQWGGWGGIRAIDEHTKLARVAINFETDLDELFKINVAKVRVTLPPHLRRMLEQPVSELCAQAASAYRQTTQSKGNLPSHRGIEGDGDIGRRELGVALTAAAIQVGEFAALQKIVARLGQDQQATVEALGLA